MKFLTIVRTTMLFYLFFFVVGSGMLSMMFPGPKNLESFLKTPGTLGLLIAMNIIAVGIFFSAAINAEKEEGEL